jgi:hypothetical protein
LVLKENNIFGGTQDLTLAIGLITFEYLRSRETQQERIKIITTFNWIEFLFFVLVGASLRINLTGSHALYLTVNGTYAPKPMTILFLQVMETSDSHNTE